MNIIQIFHTQIINKHQNLMEYPALDEVYDLSTEDLKKIQQSLRNNPHAHQHLLETVTLQIQQRKALQYFSELCQADNPYAKKVAAFNQQFLRLAAETIQKNHHARIQGIGSYQPSYIPSLQKQQEKHLNTPIPLTKKIQTENQSQFSSVSFQKIISQHRQHTDSENQTKSIQSETHSFSDERSTTTNSSVNQSYPSQASQQNTSRVTQVKMNLGAKKGQKGKIKQLMQNTLARTLVQQEVVIKRNNLNSPNFNINPHKKYHIPGQKHESANHTQMKNKKASQKQSQLSSQKSIQNTKNDQKQKNKSIKASPQDIKKTKEAVSKMKQQQKKGGSVKLPKINQYKDLVEMVKDQEQKRKNKSIKHQNVQKLPSIENHLGTQKQLEIEEKVSSKGEMKQQVYSNISQQQKDKIIESEAIQQGEKLRKNSGNQKIVSNDIIRQEQMQESLSPEKVRQLNKKQRDIEKNKQKDVKQKPKEQMKIKDKQFEIKNDLESDDLFLRQKVSDYQSKQQEIDRYSSHRASQQGKKREQTEIIQKQVKKQDNNKTITLSKEQMDKIKQDDHIDYSKKLIQQIQKQQQNQYYFFNENNTHISQVQQQPESDSNHSSKLTQSNSSFKNPNILQQGQRQKQKEKEKEKEKEKKCYSEQYWTHIREQAELKIKRFKQQKQFSQRKQLSVKSNYEQGQKQQICSTQEQNLGNQQINDTIEKEGSNTDDKQLSLVLKDEQINKMKKQFMKKSNKKITQAFPVPKIIRPKPDFDYLSVYPTFNHIFSVMYLKPVHQALNDIPNLLRDLKTMFTTHIQHFNSKSNFKPAIFLPFDHNGTFQLTNPKQLIAHAQETYIDLKVMIERVQNFNQNLHGEFNNALDDRYYRVVKTKEQVYDIITTSFLRRKGWKELPHGCSLRSSWNLFWSWSKPDIDLNKLLVWQKINHFPFNKNLSRKDLLYKNLDSFRKTFKIPMNFLPLTFNLPKQFSQLSAKFHQEQMINRDNNYWIMKPIGKSRGRGIKVVSSLSQLNFTDNIVVQKYILTPMLIDGYKFDMRIYVLVTSFHPLEAFVYRQGFARLSTQKYTLDAHSIKNTFVHLTNFAINKNNVSSNTMFAGGSKISLKTLKDKITRMGYSFTNIWSQVHEIIVKSLLGCSVSVPSFPTAFQLFGYDIMVDQQSNCHLIEINASPSLQRSYMLDEIVKQNLIDDIIDIVDPPDFDKKQIIEVLGERIQSITNQKKITPEQDLIGLARILKYKPIRKVGQMPSKMGLFEVVAPCDISRDLQTLIKAKSGANNPLNID